jgi:type I restriction enzyme S subunit
MNIEGWKVATIEECCEILDSKRIPINAEERETRIGDIPYYGANGLQGYIDDYIFDEELILIAEDGGCFDEFATRPIAYKISGKSWVNNHAHILRAKQSYSQDYIFYSLEHKDIQPFIVGGTRAKLNQFALRSIKLILPELEEEQKQIAEVLSTIDRAIAQTEAIIAKQQRIKTGLMQDLLTKGIDENGNIRSEATHKFKDSAIGRIPVEWEVEILDNLLIEKRYGISTSLSEDPIGIPVLRMNNLIDGEIDFTDIKYSNRKDAKNLTLNNNDILFNRTNSIDYVGRTAIYRDFGESISFASYLVRLVSDEKRLCSEYLNLWLNNDENQIRVKQFATIGVQQANVNPTNLGTLLLALPASINEQKRVVKNISASANCLSDIKANLSKLRSLKTGLMQDLLTGKVRVTNLLKEREPTIL